MTIQEIKVMTDKKPLGIVREELNKSLIVNPKKTVQYMNDLKLFDILKSKELNFEITSRKIKE